MKLSVLSDILSKKFILQNEIIEWFSIKCDLHNLLIVFVNKFNKLFIFIEMNCLKGVCENFNTYNYLDDYNFIISNDANKKGTPKSSL
ncbi:hypothetical protein B9T28_04390 [Acinetobacter silvestris]|uniref:Uncharacterized protein n=1 Tax=Acinetobacter silvestris TaxID=1977882 RepID=A0A1Y3CJ69_9GAMM|nr:hypothetical protein B9T28_04390 [Acinetobacter silvestris]